MRCVAALDVGTTTVRCHVIDERGRLVAHSMEKVQLFYPAPGHVEIDPDELWETIVKVIRNAVHDSGVSPESIACLGISTQRGSFTTWNPTDGKHYHRFITWKDLRADDLVKEWNSSMTIRGLRLGAQILHTVSRNKRFLAGSSFKFMNTQIYYAGFSLQTARDLCHRVWIMSLLVAYILGSGNRNHCQLLDLVSKDLHCRVSLRLLWAIQNIPGLQEAVNNGQAVFGCVDCWLLYKLTGKHMTDASSASATGLFDPFAMGWAGWLMDILKLPSTLFPKVVDTAGNFGVTPKNVFGVEVPILCSMADQAASLFGSGCFQPGDLKITMGTGSFINVNTGTNPHASITGLYPVVGWRIGNELSYIVEGASNDTGVLVEWIQAIGIISQAAETEDLANTVGDSDGVCFIPAFSGLQAPINDHSAAAGFIGIKPTTRKGHIVRALLESIVYRILLLYESLCAETSFRYEKIRVDGGVSRNNFIVQLLADLTGLEVERATCIEMSILGVTFLAGLQCGIWTSKEEVQELRHVERIFKPNKDFRSRYKPAIAEWRRAINRFQKWY